MTSSAPPTGLILGGGATGSAIAQDDPNLLALIYQNLLSGAADIKAGLGDKVLVMDSGAIGLAGSALATAGGSETSAEVANNLSILGSIAAFCSANTIAVQVDANLTDDVLSGNGTNQLINNWATAAAAVGLPINAVEDIQEHGISSTATQAVSSGTLEAGASAALANTATIEASSVYTLVQDYGSVYASVTASVAGGATLTTQGSIIESSYTQDMELLAVGDMEGGGTASMAGISAWWNDYNAAVNAGTVVVYAITEQIVSNGTPETRTLYNTNPNALGTLYQTETIGTGASAETITIEGIVAHSTIHLGGDIGKFSYITADTGWDAPWITAEMTPKWQGYLEALYTLAVSDGMSFNVILQGMLTDTSGSQFVKQAEENAAGLANLVASGSVDVANVLVRSWQPLPVGIGQITSPTSVTNAAAEINATFPLYANGSITAQDPVTTTAPGQMIVTTGSTKSIVPLSVQWGTADVLAGDRLAVVIIDQTGSLAAGTLTHPAANILVLNGDSADLAAELSSVTLNEPYSGPDTIDVETFGTAGQLSDNQISVLALASGQNPNSINATSNLQGWISSSAFLNSGTVMTSETLNWNTSGTLPTMGSLVATTPGQSAFVKIDTVHEPLAEYGVETTVVANGSTIDWDSNLGQGITFGLTSWLTNKFDPTAQVTSLIVQSTTNTFDPVSGRLETSVDSLAPDSPTVLHVSGTTTTTVLNTFATAFSTGGTQVVEMNTGDNPAWQAGWGNQFNSATLTQNGTGQLVEAFFQGGSSDPSFTIDDVFDPSNGNLWEEFQSAAPPTFDNSVPNYTTGPLYVTEFNTGDNPNWDYVDWKSTIASDTEVRTDSLIMQNFTGLVENFPSAYAGDLNAYPYEFVNGSTLDLLNLPGTINVNLGALGTVVINSQTLTSGLSGLTAIDASGATGSVTITGLASGGSTLIGGDITSTITGYGHDTIVAGSGTSIINTGSGASTILISSATGTSTITGNNNVVTAVTGGTVAFNGTGDTLGGSGINVSTTTGTTRVSVTGNNDTVTAVAGSMITDATANTSLIVNGNSVTAVGAAGDTITETGVGDVATFVNGGTFDQGSASSSATLNGNSITASMNAAGGTVTATGTNDTIFASVGGPVDVIASGSNAIVAGGTGTGNVNVTDTGTNDTIGAGHGADTITTSGHGALVFGGVGSLVFTDGGSNNTISASSGATTINANHTDLLIFGGLGTLVVNDSGSYDTVIAAAGSTTINASGSNALMYGGSGNLVLNDHGTYDTFIGEIGATTVNSSGSHDTVAAGAGPMTVNASSSNALIYGGTGSLVLNDSGAHDTIIAAAGASTVNATGNDLTVYGGPGSLKFIGGAGTATIIGASDASEQISGGSGALVVGGDGSNNATIAGGSGGTTLFGSSGSAATFANATSSGSLMYQAYAGNETLTASMSTTNNLLFSGADANGADSIVGGSGNDTLYAAAGTDSLGGGTGNNLFIFDVSFIGGTAKTDVITDFSASSSNQVWLAGYGTPAAAAALSGAVSSGGNTTLTLSDSTKITFIGIASASSLSGHIYSS